MCKCDNISSFESGLQQLICILEPLAHTCQCLEPSKATASNVYHFWLAVLATYERYIQENNDVDGLQLTEDVIDEICKTVNAHWCKLTTGSGKSVYVSTFFLDPHALSIFVMVNILTWYSPTGYIKSPIFRLKNMNPISAHITIPACPDPNCTNHGANFIAPPVRNLHDTYLCKTMPSYSIVRKYLLGVLMEEICAKTTLLVFNSYEDVESIVSCFHHQFTTYTCQELPFTYTPGTEPCNYWKKLTFKKEANVLAVGFLYQCQFFVANWVILTDSRT